MDTTGVTNLVGYWRLNENSGTTVSDLGSGNNAGTLMGATWSIDVPFNQNTYYSIQGISQTVYCLLCRKILYQFLNCQSLIMPGDRY